MEYTIDQNLVVFGVAFLISGAASGFLGGLFGVGGGAVLVPVLYEMFRLTGVPLEIQMPLAVGTSLAVIIPTTMISYRNHAKKGAVDSVVLRSWALPAGMSAFVAGLCVGEAPSFVFKLVFTTVACVTAANLLWRRRPPEQFTMPSKVLMNVYGLVIGSLSALMGVGGGAIAGLVMQYHGAAIHRAVGTSAGIGIFVSIAGALSYILAGWSRPQLPPYSLGFVSLVGVSLLVPASMLFVRYGVALAHKFSRQNLERAFALYLIVASARLISSLF